MIVTVRNAGQVQCRGHALMALLAGHRAQQHRYLDVLVGVQHRHQVVEMEDVPDRAGPPRGQLAVRQVRKILAADEKQSEGRLVDPGDRVQQGRLAVAVSGSSLLSRS